MTRATLDLRDELALELTAARERTLSLVATLGEDALRAQRSPVLSPILWDLGHVAAFEELWLLRRRNGRPPIWPDADRIFDPLETPRAERGSLPLPSLAETLAVLDAVRGEVLDGLSTVSDDQYPSGPGFLHRMVASHEAQHAEIVLQSLDLGPEPVAPAGARETPPPRAPADDERRIAVPAGAFEMGAPESGFAYDNERPRRTVHVGAFVMDAHPVTCRRWLEFMEEGGYERRDCWTEAGLRWRDDERPSAPQGWVRRGMQWHVRRLGHEAPLDPREPVQHVSAHEADAFAAWAGARLPSEAEWEKAASFDPRTGASLLRPWGSEPPAPRHANLSRASWGPAAVGSHPDGASPLGFHEMLGDVYQWTSSELRAHPDFVAFPYPGYSEVFFSRGYRVLRGASWAGGPLLARNSYRNWDLPQRRQIFAGLRLAWDA